MRTGPACKPRSRRRAPQRVIVTHGSVEPMVRWLREQGLEAGAFDTQYGDDTVEADAAGSDEPAAASRCMKRFAALYTALDATTSTHDKLDALTSYFAVAEPEDAAWASYFLAGGKPRQSVPTRLLSEIARERAGLPAWLFEESYHAVGDLAETIAHILPPAQRTSELGLTQWIEQRVLTLRGVASARVARRVCLAIGTNSTGAAAFC